MCASRTRAYAAVSRGMQAGGILSAMYHFRIDSSAGFCGKPVSSPRTSRSNETSGTYVRLKRIENLKVHVVKFKNQIWDCKASISFAIYIKKILDKFFSTRALWKWFGRKRSSRYLTKSSIRFIFRFWLSSAIDSFLPRHFQLNIWIEGSKISQLDKLKTKLIRHCSHFSSPRLVRVRRSVSPPGTNRFARLCEDISICLAILNTSVDT